MQTSGLGQQPVDVVTGGRDGYRRVDSWRRHGNRGAHSANGVFLPVDHDTVIGVELAQQRTTVGQRAGGRSFIGWAAR